MKRIFRIFALMMAIVVFACTSVACSKPSDEEVALTAEEVQKVEEVYEVLDIVADVEIPELGDCFASGPKLFAASKTGYNGLNSEKYQSMRLDFSVVQNVSMSFVFSDAFREELEKLDPSFAEMMLAMFENIGVSYDLKGYVLLTETACQFTYTKVKMEMDVSSIDADIDMPFALYMDSEEVYLRYDDFKYVVGMAIPGESETGVDAGEIIRDFLGDLIGKWIDLDRNYVTDELAGYFTEAFAQCGNALGEELNMYSEYIEENLSQKFVKKGGKYVLSSNYFKDFVNELSSSVSGSDDAYEDVDIAEGDLKYNKFTGDFEFDISDMNTPKIALNYDMDAEQTTNIPGLSSGDASLTIKLVANANCSYKFSGFNTTTLSRPTEVFGWPTIG